MTITLTLQEQMELWDEAALYNIQQLSTNQFEFVTEMPKYLGKGYKREIELHPNLWLAIFDCDYYDNVVVKYPTSNHPLQFGAILSGTITNSFGLDRKSNMFISGGGIQSAMTVEFKKLERIIGIDIEMSPDLLATFFPGEDGGIPTELKMLAKDNDWQTLLHSNTTPAIRALAEQILNCPYQGMTKRIYLQAKVLELIALQLAPILADSGTQQTPPQLKSKTVAQIYYAKEILLSRLDNPPSLLELAQQVGVSDRTLRRGFKQLFNTTILRYLSDQRIELAEQLLRQGNTTVAEVANRFGCSQQGRFAAAFKRKYGITPSECLSGKKSVLE